MQHKDVGYIRGSNSEINERFQSVCSYVFIYIQEVPYNKALYMYMLK